MKDHKSKAAPRDSRGRRISLAASVAAAAFLAACGSTPPAPNAGPAAGVPARWEAPLPHQGQTADLTRWWQQFDDPALAQLIATAQDVSPTIATARSRIAQAQATRTAAGAALAPNLSGNASLVRGRQEARRPIDGAASGQPTRIGRNNKRRQILIQRCKIQKNSVINKARY